MIETSRAVLRPPEPIDLEFLYTFRNDEAIKRQLSGFSTGYSQADLTEWLESHRNRHNEILWVIADRKANQCIGHVGLYRIDYRIRRAELAIMIGDQGYQGLGVGKEVCRAVLAYGFKELNLHKVSLDVLMTNGRAIHLYESLGFQRDGVLRHDQFHDGEFVDVLIMSLLDHEWRNNGAREKARSGV